MHQYEFRYVLTNKMNQDPIERFFGKIRLAGSQNDQPSMPTFMQLYNTMSIYSLLRPPKFGNCCVVDEKPLLDASDFRALIELGSASNSSPGFIDQLKEKLDKLILVEDWECEDVITVNGKDTAQVVDCILYYVVGFLSRKLMKTTTCDCCRSAFTIPQNSSAEASLTSTKSRGGLLHLNANLFELLRVAEEHFAKNADSQSVYWETVEHVLDTKTLTFPCAQHKEEVIAQILHYFLTMRMRQHCKAATMNLKKQAQEKKKLAKLCSS